MADHVEVKLRLTATQVKKLFAGKTITIPATQLLDSKYHTIRVHPDTAKKIQKARKANKGVRISMTKSEMQHSGEGLKEILQGIRKGAQFVKSKIIDSDPHQKIAKPLVRKAVQAAVASATPFVQGIAGQEGVKLLNQGVDKLDEVTSAYGMKKGRRRAKSYSRGGAMQRVRRSDSPIPYVPANGGWPDWMFDGHRGGSFRVN